MKEICHFTLSCRKAHIIVVASLIIIFYREMCHAIEKLPKYSRNTRLTNLLTPTNATHCLQSLYRNCTTNTDNLQSAVFWSE